MYQTALSVIRQGIKRGETPLYVYTCKNWKWIMIPLSICVIKQYFFQSLLLDILLLIIDLWLVIELFVLCIFKYDCKE